MNKKAKIFLRKSIGAFEKRQVQASTPLGVGEQPSATAVNEDFEGPPSERAIHDPASVARQNIRTQPFQ